MRCAMSAMASFSQRRVEGFNHISLLSLRPLNHRPLEGRQSSPSFIRPRDDHNAEISAPLGRSIQKALYCVSGASGGFGGAPSCRWQVPSAVLVDRNKRPRKDVYRCTTTSEGEDMNPKRILSLAIAASALTSSAALAATGTPERVRGTIASATADWVTVDTHADKPVTVALTGNTSYLKGGKTTLNKVEKGSYIGTADRKRP